MLTFCGTKYFIPLKHELHIKKFREKMAVTFTEDVIRELPRNFCYKRIGRLDLGRPKRRFLDVCGRTTITSRGLAD
jgi:hypothetical protein